MTARELFDLAGQHSLVLLVYFVAAPVFSWIIGLIHGENKGGTSPWKYLYSVLVYLVCIPGILAAVLTAYSIFLFKENLLEANVLVYFLPIISMTATLVLISKRVTFDEIPGFGRLSGLMTLISITFVIILAIQKTRIWVIFFGGGLTNLVLIAVGLFALLKWGAYMLFRGRKEPKIKAPRFGVPKG